MSISKSPTLFLCAAFLALFAFSQPADAKKNQIAKAFKGKIIVSEDALPAPDAEDSKGTIKSYRSLALKTITSVKDDNGIANWQFHFTAFVKSKPKTSSLTLEFYTDDKEKLFVADKRLNGADPNLKILASTVQISEDENLNRNRKYVMKLVAYAGKKSTILAQTKITTK